MGGKLHGRALACPLGPLRGAGASLERLSLRLPSLFMDAGRGAALFLVLGGERGSRRRREGRIRKACREATPIRRPKGGAFFFHRALKWGLRR